MQLTIMGTPATFPESVTMATRVEAGLGLAQRVRVGATRGGYGGPSLSTTAPGIRAGLCRPTGSATSATNRGT